MTRREGDGISIHALTGELSPAVIRSQLLLEDLEDFDRQYRQIMADAIESLNLSPLIGFLLRWGNLAFYTQKAIKEEQEATGS